MIEGVKIIPLKKIPDERGMILHMLRTTDPHFEKFGEVYFSVAYPGVIKGWHLHTKQTQFYAVISGMIKLVMYDERKDSKTYGELMEIFTGEDNYQLIRIPVGVVNGYKTIGVKPAIVANCATEPHEQNEMLRYDPLKSHIKYDWSLVHR
ncbi:dTDP-4-dehydrorhamnose 3,5-epimerase [candidate division WOR-1 bacterium RIFOXYA12_FULL_52_29]|uniref:dTDP-4-dehydrorhamnose 3,5-epimerase n=1 Tax=candidate division WOR-1 bacterium RIFOXYC12_FULL_54_18 TaxID=1802584 RepID=A0A1F4T558_UNCSA|nr:MAG: dTDP-4-dehydrorhamnose 3,5-epimerase [candidate division WOR-1 bacterium RIFOXYA2_FULL_51_19]OGC17437.1 MAG: dTDP-4-dehydrorhamnose 3,5-epimerase [candidate division WOR-1 bacterium RIFOXYA12_FULL_52_29]OGC26296.1 MAG: dTDP-4-dehydrorhamnose 3,5-epimerase [candidate division WOR-1 bacterium RIFOXYB2_FULL_45_9]OGC27854.1 MAG: dTDP-4-dehydrorhamnose 3,5-epimerase [candidate division WOR-1 bacterium RIFOXYC12_FULL_54_18]OGC29857.1 MAG: dTDP-4-dehydrorhamnose 3,5-epimerase [candidate divisi